MFCGLYYYERICHITAVMRSRPFVYALLSLLLLTFRAHGGGSGLNVAVIINQSSSNSVQLGNYYREKRQIPPQNVLNINWTGSNIEWSQTDYNNTLLNPFMAMLSARKLTNQIDYVMLSMDIPYRVSTTTNGDNSTTSTLFYGFKPDSSDLNTCPLANGSTSLYAGSEGIFRQTPPISAGSNSFLVFMITHTNLSMAEQIIDQGVASDSTFPTQTVWLNHTSDTARNVRYLAFDNTVFNSRVSGNFSVMITNIDYWLEFNSQILGIQHGYSYFLVLTNTFAPGAMADCLTSVGGMVFENTGQTTLLEFLGGGAAASFGTVVEPCNYQQKFPDPQTYFYQARGFSLGECYYQSVTNPYQGLLVGEPLAAPFAQPGSGSWSGLAGNSLLSGTTNLSLQFSASDARHPLQRVDLFVDGNWMQAITNIPPQAGNVLKATVNGHLISYTVPANATVQSVTTGLVSALNYVEGTTLVLPVAHGDRVELQSLADYTTRGSQMSLSVTSTNPSGPLTTYLTASKTNFVDSVAQGLRLYLLMGTPSVGSYLMIGVTKTNGAVINLAATNTVSGATLGQLTQQLMNLITTNASPGLQGPDGLVASDLIDYSPSVQFTVRPNSGGFAAAQIQATLSSSADITIQSTGTGSLTDNINDLAPRDHAYVMAGVTNLMVGFALNSTNLMDGYHELEAVAFEGTSVRTQTRAVQNVRVQNTPLTATFTVLVGGTNSALEGTLQFNVTANETNISTIQLYSTGGWVAGATNQASATLAVAATNLGLGLHPFYAVVTDTAGHQYRTETQNFRIVGMDTPFVAQMTAPPPTVTWLAAAGRSYDIFSCSPLSSNVFVPRGTVVATNSLGQWAEPRSRLSPQFYRIRVTP